MASCTSCGNDVTGKKFCPECGIPVQPTGSAENQPASMNTCPRCNGAVKPGSAFCMHCGSSLSLQTAAATATPTTPSQPLTRPCIACHAEIPVGMAFCTNCGQSMQASTSSAAPATLSYAVCTNCGQQNNPGVNFCAGCGSPTTQSGYMQPSQSSQPYSQYPQQYGQMAYQQQPLVLRCPVCMAMSPVGTTNCPSCHTSLAGIAPTSANMPVQGQQGGMGGFIQGAGGNMAMGALGGAAAVIGGEILLHEMERGFERDRGYGHRQGEGLLGDVGDLANDVGLF